MIPIILYVLACLAPWFTVPVGLVLAAFAILSYLVWLLFNRLTVWYLDILAKFKILQDRLEGPAMASASTVAASVSAASASVASTVSSVGASVSSGVASVSASVSSVAEKAASVSRIGLMMIIFFSFGALLCTLRYVLTYIAGHDAEKATKDHKEYKRSRSMSRSMYILSQLSKLMWIVSALCGCYELLSEFTRVLTLTTYVSSIAKWLSPDDESAEAGSASTTPLSSSVSATAGYFSTSPTTSTSPSVAASVLSPTMPATARETIVLLRSALLQLKNRKPASDAPEKEHSDYAKCKASLKAEYKEALSRYNRETASADPSLAPPSQGKFSLPDLKRAYDYFKQHGVLILAIVAACVLLGYCLITWFCFPDDDDADDKKEKKDKKNKKNVKSKPAPAKTECARCWDGVNAEKLFKAVVIPDGVDCVEIDESLVKPSLLEYAFRLREKRAALNQLYEEARGKPKYRRVPRGSWFKVRGKDDPIYVLEEDQPTFLSKHGHVLDDTFDDDAEKRYFASRRAAIQAPFVPRAQQPLYNRAAAQAEPWEDRDSFDEAKIKPAATTLTSAATPPVTSSIAKPLPQAAGATSLVGVSNVRPPAPVAKLPVAEHGEVGATLTKSQKHKQRLQRRAEKRALAAVATPKTEAKMVDSPFSQAISVHSFVSISARRDGNDLTSKGFACGGHIVTTLHGLAVDKDGVFSAKVTYINRLESPCVSTVVDMIFKKIGDDVAVSVEPHRFAGLKSVQNVPGKPLPLATRLTVFNDTMCSSGEVVKYIGDKMCHSASTEDGWSGCPIVVGNQIYVHCGNMPVGSSSINYALPLNFPAPGGSLKGTTPASPTH